MSIPYFALYPRDFEADTSHLTLEEDGAYNRLLRLCWMTPGCSLPDDDAWIMRRMRVDAETYERVIRVVIEEFFTRSESRVSNARLTREYEKSSAAHERRVNAGSRGGKSKALKTKGAGSSNAKAMPKQPEPEPEPEPELSIEEPKGSLCEPTHANDVSEAVALYNGAAARQAWPHVQKITPARRKAILARLRDVGGVDGWRDAIGRAEGSDFLCGRTSKPWTGFGFDWICKQANFTKLMEGNYDNRDRPNPTAPQPDATALAIAVAGRTRKPSEPDWI